MTAPGPYPTTIMIRVAGDSRVVTLEISRRFRRWLNSRLDYFKLIPSAGRPDVMEFSGDLDNLFVFNGWEDSGGQLEPDQKRGIFPPLNDDIYLESAGLYPHTLRLSVDGDLIIIGLDDDSKEFRTETIYLENATITRPTMEWKK